MKFSIGEIKEFSGELNPAAKAAQERADLK